MGRCPAAMVGGQRDKSAAFQNPCWESIAMSLDKLQFLMFRGPHGENHAAALSKLREERLRNLGSGSGNEDGVERSEFRQAERAVAARNYGVRVAGPGHLRGGRGSQ